MASATLSTKGQIVIPQSVRESHGFTPGMKFDVEVERGAIILRPNRAMRPTTLEELVGCARYHGPPKTLEEMEEGIAIGARESARDLSR